MPETPPDRLGALFKLRDLPVEPFDPGALHRRIGPALGEPAERAADVAEREDHILDKKEIEFRIVVWFHAPPLFPGAERKAQGAKKWLKRFARFLNHANRFSF